MVLGSGERPQIREQAERLHSVIAASADIVLWDLAFAESLADVDADLAIVFGGDGSILRAAHQMAYRQVPVVAVNLGKLGFLADLSAERFLEVLPQICRGEYRVVEHLMYECTIERDGNGSLSPSRPERGRNSRRRPLRDPRHSSVCRCRTGHHLQLRRPDRQHAGRLDRPQPVGRRTDLAQGSASILGASNQSAHADEPAGDR